SSRREATREVFLDSTGFARDPFTVHVPKGLHCLCRFTEWVRVVPFQWFERAVALRKVNRVVDSTARRELARASLRKSPNRLGIKRRSAIGVSPSHDRPLSLSVRNRANKLAIRL